MTKKIITVAIAILMTLFVAGAADASPNVVINPDTGADPVLIPVGGLAGLGANYISWPCTTLNSCEYSVQVIDLSVGGVRFDIDGVSTSSSWSVPITWAPTESDIGNEFIISAGGAYPKTRYAKVVEQPASVLPELGTVILTTTGLIGLVGLVRLRRRD